MRRRIMLINLVMIILVSSITNIHAASEIIPAVANQPNYELSTVDEFQSAIEEANNDGIVTPIETIRIQEDTTPSAISDYVNIITQEAMESAENVEVVLKDEGTGEYTGAQTIHIDEISNVTIEFAECEEADGYGLLNDFLFTPAYAISRSGSSCLWKGYGDRYFTAKMTISWGFGSAWCKLENWIGNTFSDSFFSWMPCIPQGLSTPRCCVIFSC